MTERDEVSRYLSKNPDSGVYRYYRRVPVEVAHADRRTHIKQSLKTRNLREALERAIIIHRATEQFWSALVVGGDAQSAADRYRAAIAIAQSLGFPYRPADEIATLPFKDVEKRVLAARQEMTQAPHVAEAIIGAARQPSPRLSGLLDLYKAYNTAGLTGMAPDQWHRHIGSRERAIRYAMECLGDLELGAISRAELLSFRTWWTDKISREKLTAYSANRCFSDIAGMLSVVDGALHSEYQKVWSRLRIKETNATKLKKRPPFPADWIRDRLLKPGVLDALNLEARMIVYVMIETGMRLGEVCNLRPQDIHLDDDIAFLDVADREDRRQKTDYSVRRIPLVGVSLWAMRQCPQGFSRYRDKADSASAIINKVMRSAGLMPSEDHTLYSLRHTFQDRLENAGCSDRMQADLMGHEFGRPVYGDGAEMKRRHAFLEGIKFAWPA